LTFDAPVYFVIASMTVLWTGMTLWSLVPELRRLDAQRRALQNAMELGSVRSIDVRATRVLELLEEEDEGACFVFEIGSDRLVVTHGQQFYPTARFPNEDFSVVDILDDKGAVICHFLRCWGRKLKPIQRIPADMASPIKLANEPIYSLPGTLEELRA